MTQTLPNDFLSELDSVKPITNVFGDVGRYWKPTTAMMWYDGIIDDMLSHPGTTMKETAARLGRSYSVINTVANSDLFKARWRQRREAFDEALKDKLTDKLAKVAEAALDHTLVALEKKRDAIPLPLLHEIAKGSLDRLGYGPEPPRSGSPSVAVNIQQNNPTQTVSPEALARAREHLRILELKRIPHEVGSVTGNQKVGSVSEASSPVAGLEKENEGED